MFEGRFRQRDDVDDEERRTGVRTRTNTLSGGLYKRDDLLKEVDAADVKAALIARHEAVVEEICRE